MCIIQGVVDKVSDTRIMAAPFQRRNKRYQLTVYENKVAFGNMRGKSKEPEPQGAWAQMFGPLLGGPAVVEDPTLSTTEQQEPVAMILPFPNGETCNLVDLSGYSDIFKDLKDVIDPPSFERGMYLGGKSWANDALAVYQVGSYKVSVATNLEELARLDFDVFKLDPTVQTVLDGNYPPHFGFVVCIMDKGADFHPIGYIHQIKEKMFIPTYHFHDHGDGVHGTEHADWDHEIYIMNPHRKTLRKMEKSSPGLTVDYATAGTMKDLEDTLQYEKLPYVKPTDFKDMVRCNVGAGFNQNVDFIIPVNLNN